MKNEYLILKLLEGTGVTPPASRFLSGLERGNDGYFYTNAGDVYASLGHGASGIGYFLLRLFQVTGQDEHLAVAKGLLDFEFSRAEETDEQVRFHRSESDPTFFPYWRVGAAGIGSVALRFHAALGEPRYIEIARKIARDLTDAYGVFPANFLGMTGSATSSWTCTSTRFAEAERESLPRLYRQAIGLDFVVGERA